MRTRTRDTEDKNADRLSNLADCVILHILSFLDSTKDALQTCILSKRWTNIWKRLPNLILASSQFNTVKTNNFLSHFLSLRDSSTFLHHIIINRREVIMDPRLIETIMKYAISHDVQQLEFNFKCEIQSFPPSLFSSHTLTSLQLLVAHPKRYVGKNLFPNSLHLPALTILALRSFYFSAGNDGRVEPFSTLKRLKSLIIYDCEVRGAQNLCISSTGLTVLTCHLCTNFEIKLSTPSLREFHLKGGVSLPKLCESKSNLPNITHVSINLIASWNFAETSLVLLKWLVELANIQSLSVNSTTLEVLSSVPDLLKTESPFLCNLKSLKVKKPRYSSIPDGVVNFLRQKSRLAEVDIIELI